MYTPTAYKLTYCFHNLFQTYIIFLSVKIKDTLEGNELAENLYLKKKTEKTTLILIPSESMNYAHQ